MSGFKVARDSAGRCRACGPNTDLYQPAVPLGGTLEISPVFLPIDLTQDELDALNRNSVDEVERVALKIDAPIMSLVNQTKTEWLAWASANFPTLTAAEKTRLGNLFWVVAIGVRRAVRYG